MLRIKQERPAPSRARANSQKKLDSISLAGVHPAAPGRPPVSAPAYQFMVLDSFSEASLSLGRKSLVSSSTS